jgi:GH15 family glucan-1,4-alpha-glucosidase
VTASTPIGDHALIGDGRSAALVSQSGSIDWLCWPRFDSPSLLGRLLDPDAGHWQLAPRDVRHSERVYLDDTNILETCFQTASGTATVTDLMPVTDEHDKGRQLWPEHHLLRLVTCREGQVAVDMELLPRPGYALGGARIRDAGRLGVRIETREGLYLLRSDAPLSIGNDGAIRASADLAADQSIAFSLTLAIEGPAIAPDLTHAEDLVSGSTAWWRGWSRTPQTEGPWREAVTRSALALKLMLFAPSGAIVAAPTTSLPELPGGPLNWDYRFCWLRDASLTARALFGLGHVEEAEAFVSWLIHTTRLSRPRLGVLYDVYGRRPERERELRHMSGHMGSRPVRVGNAAQGQLQLDVYGEVVDAAAQLVRRRDHIDRDTQSFLTGIGDEVMRTWRLPDAGIWEPRGEPQPRTHSRLLCWTALDRLHALAADGYLPRRLAARYAEVRDQIRREIVERCWNRRLQSYVSTLDGAEVDASLLLMPWYGFEPPGAQRIRLTRARVDAELGAAGGLLYRNRDPFTAGEGAFGACGFWRAEYLAMGGGPVEDALAAFESLLQYGNDVGLFAEEFDPDTGEALGNFPQAFTHVGLINAALSLRRRIAELGNRGWKRHTVEWSPAQVEART